MLAMEAQAPRGIRQPAFSLTTIATVRRFDMLAPTAEPAGQVANKYASTSIPASRICASL
jgi:hypothetical protein